MGSDTNVDRAIYALLSKQCPAMWLGFPIGAGNVFWVDGFTGLDTNVGTEPDLPFQTIRHALDQCVNDHNDYIIVLDAWNEAMPITIDRSRVHILGLSSSPNHPFVMLNNGALDTEIFQVNVLSTNCEISGFHLGGGPTHACIENDPGAMGGPMGLYIHDCVFGHFFTAGGVCAPLHGIHIRANATNIRIENCVFLGTPGGKGLITGDGIRWSGGDNPLNGYIGKNRFQGLPGIAINFVLVQGNTGGITIEENTIVCPGDTEGSAITLDDTTRGFLVVGNKALYGKATAAMINNPYLDLTVAAPFNTWIENYKGNALIDPA